MANEDRDAESCQLFVEHLSGAALTWLSYLEANTIDSYYELTTSFLKNYGVFMQKRASNADLWTMDQTQKESLRTFINQFKGVVTNVAIPDEAAISALWNALWHESRFREDLILNQPTTLSDALHRAKRFIEMEEENAAMTKRQGLTKVPALKEKAKEEHYEPRQHYDTNYHREDKGKMHRHTTSMTRSSKPWNRWDRATDPKPEQVYYKFHKSYTHSTNECRQLQSLILARFKKGDLDIEPNRRRMPSRNKYRWANDDDHERRDDRRQPDELDRRAEHSHSSDHQGHPKRANDGPRQVEGEPVSRRQIHMIMGGLTSCHDSVRSIKSYRGQAETQ